MGLFNRLRGKTTKSVDKQLSSGLTTTGALDVVVRRAARVEEVPEEIPKLFGYLQYVEFSLVVLVGFCVAALTIYSAFWILFGCGEEIHDRVTRVVKAVNDNWRVDLLVLIPLFFRPIFKFLFYLKKGPWGIESGRQLPQKEKPIPQAYEGEEKAAKQ